MPYDPLTHNVSIEDHFRRLARSHEPRYRFHGSTTNDWKHWRNALLPAVLATLGNAPKVAPPNPEVLAEWREEGLIKQRVSFQVEPGLSVIGLLFRPDNHTGRLPAILCCHGHGPWGKDPVMGDRSSPDIAGHIQSLNYDYGLQMAKAGFVTMAIDWRGFGERDDRRKPLYHDTTQGRDLCDVHNLRALLLGMTLLGLDVHDGRRAIDFLATQSFVDPAKIGVMGLSFGGTMSTWLALADERVKAADVICYSARFADFGLLEVNVCGSQITPGLFDLADIPDLQGLIAPRPLLVEIGLHDTCMRIDGAMSCYHEVEKIYAAAGAADRLELDLFEGGHRWGGAQSVAFFQKWL